MEMASRAEGAGAQARAAPVFLWPVRVYYEDTDAGGVVYHANYLRFMERARSEWLRSLGQEQDRLREEQGLLFTVSRVRVDFLKPARFNDLLEVSVRLSRLGRASLELAQETTRRPDGVLCRAEIRVACIDARTFRPRAIPDPLLRGLHV
jgi:acyl-CoA thioester hydrolase